MYFRGAISLILTILFLSCSLEYDNSVKEDLSESIPSSILYDVLQVQVKNGVPKATFQAEEAKIWEERDETELFYIQFQEFGEDEAVVTDGNAEYRLINENNDATIKGEISGYSSRNDASLEAEELTWEDENRILKGKDEGKVTISMDEGTVLSGSGFSADFYSNSLEFQTDVNGTIKTGSEDE